MDLIYFDVTEHHIKLLRAAYVGWEDCEFGAPAIDCKRPYGNSYVYGDIAEILGIEAPDGDTGFTEAQEDQMRQLHRETQTVLQIILAVGYMKPGRYAAKRYEQNWQPVDEQEG